MTFQELLKWALANDAIGYTVVFGGPTDDQSNYEICGARLVRLAPTIAGYGPRIVLITDGQIEPQQPIPAAPQKAPSMTRAQLLKALSHTVGDNTPVRVTGDGTTTDEISGVFPQDGQILLRYGQRHDPKPVGIQCNIHYMESGTGESQTLDAYLPEITLPALCDAFRAEDLRDDPEANIDYSNADGMIVGPIQQARNRAVYGFVFTLSNQSHFGTMVWSGVIYTHS